MQTKVIPIEKNNIDYDSIRSAASIIKSGGMVAFPTETVYGLGASAFDESAIKNIFTAKGRPSDNPLIVHINSIDSLNNLVTEITEDALKLIKTFWPGPLTIVFKKTNLINSIISSGLDTVAIRIPSNKIALELIKESGVPIVAPSANTSGKPSPTQAKHVIDDLYGKVDAIIDGGSCKVGLESTVIDLTNNIPMILRPGGISKEQIENVLTNVKIDPLIVKNFKNNNFIPKSPGMKYTHYSPKAKIIVIKGKTPNIIKKINQLIEEYKETEESLGILATEQTKDYYNSKVILSLGDRDFPDTMAANLFYSFRKFDELSVSLILAEAVEDNGIGLAIMNRIYKASGYSIIEV